MEIQSVFYLEKPSLLPPLDPDFRPPALANRRFRQEVENSGGGEPLVLGLERTEGSFSRFEIKVLPADHPWVDSNLYYVERLLKFLLWQRGGWKVYVGGSPLIAQHLSYLYSPTGERAFDHQFMGNSVYGHPFTIVSCRPDEVPPEKETSQALGRHLDGCRIGFDLGASDRKVSAVIDGEPVFSEEVIWEPRKQTDPNYHYREIMASLRAAMAHMPQVDAIGGSSAGVYVQNQVRAASLFRGIPAEKFNEVRHLFLRIRQELGVPLEIVNDGEVTALAGSMSLEDNAVLGIALGSSQAGGYVTPEGNITDWLNELAFVPVDYQQEGPIDEWSGDRGVGALYFSQQCVFRLAPRAGISIPEHVTDAEKLKVVQQELEEGHPGARHIWETMGIYLGYTLAHYADFYDMKHLLLLGRCTSGKGGPLMLEGARKVLQQEFPALFEKLQIHLPDEKIRRVGQSIAAASLPAIAK